MLDENKTIINEKHILLNATPVQTNAEKSKQPTYSYLITSMQDKVIKHWTQSLLSLTHDINSKYKKKIFFISSIFRLPCYHKY
jgi:alpha-N-acetylglucosamine transferase